MSKLRGLGPDLLRELYGLVSKLTRNSIFGHKSILRDIELYQGYSKHYLVSKKHCKQSKFIIFALLYH